MFGTVNVKFEKYQAFIISNSLNINKRLDSIENNITSLNTLIYSISKDNKKKNQLSSINFEFDKNLNLIIDDLDE